MSNSCSFDTKHSGKRVDQVLGKFQKMILSMNTDDTNIQSINALNTHAYIKIYSRNRISGNIWIESLYTIHTIYIYTESNTMLIMSSCQSWTAKWSDLAFKFAGEERHAARKQCSSLGHRNKETYISRKQCCQKNFDVHFTYCVFISYAVFISTCMCNMCFRCYIVCI